MSDQLGDQPQLPPGDGVWPPPEPRRPSRAVSDEAVRLQGPASPDRRSMVRSGFVVATLGGVVLGYLVLVRVFTGEETNCTAHRGVRYRDCVRSSDLSGLVIQGLAVGFATAAMVMVLIGVVRQRREPRSVDHENMTAILVAGSVVLASIVGWVLGAQGLWAPDRPFPYEPIANSQAHAILVTGGLLGLIVGASTAALLRNERTFRARQGDR